MAKKAVAKRGKGAAKKSTKTPAKAAGKAPAVPEALSPFVELRERMDRLFDDVFHGWGLPSWSREWPGLETFGRQFEWPSRMAGMVDVRFDVSETDDHLDISAEMPGMDEKDIELGLSDGLLTIKGEKKAETEKKEKDYYVSERRYGSFRRSFRLPETVDADKIKASFEKGVLHVTLPKLAAAKSKAKKIAISKS